MREAVIVAARRSPFGKFGGAFKDIRATDLGAHAIREALAQVELPGDQVDHVLMGMVVQAGAGQIPSRQAAIKAGIPVTVPSETLNKVCASSLYAVNMASLLIGAGDAGTVVAGGMESMSQAPYLLPKARYGYRMGNGEIVDSMVRDGLWCAFDDVHMGVHGSSVAREFKLSRERQDAWAFRSHERAAAATDAGLLLEEIAPLSLPTGAVDRDEAIRRDTSLEKLARLKPAFEPEGTVTAGNAPGLNDGASAMVVMDAQRAKDLGLEPLARIVSYGWASAEPRYLATVPAYAGQKALQKAGLSAKDLSRVEINEAFAAVALTSTDLLEVDPEIVNVNGGAVAFGHPVGASGARILMTLVYELRRRGGGYGLATICSGGGQGEATIVKVD